jgi:hypothetical protein
MLRREIVQRRRIAFMRATGRPRTALQKDSWCASGRVPAMFLQSRVRVGCGAHQGDAPAMQNPAAQRAYESA